MLLNLVVYTTHNLIPTTNHLIRTTIPSRASSSYREELFRFIFVSNTDRPLQHSIRLDRDWSAKGDKIMAESKRLSFSSGKRSSGNNSMYRRSASSLSSNVITLNQPPKGKRALLCCVSYKKQKFELKGTTHDLKNMKNLLVERFRFPLDSILILAGNDFRHEDQLNYKFARTWWHITYHF